MRLNIEQEAQSVAVSATALRMCSGFGLPFFSVVTLFFFLFLESLSWSRKSDVLFTGLWVTASQNSFFLFRFAAHVVGGYVRFRVSVTWLLGSRRCCVAFFCFILFSTRYLRWPVLTICQPSSDGSSHTSTSPSRCCLTRWLVLPSFVWHLFDNGYGSHASCTVFISLTHVTLPASERRPLCSHHSDKLEGMYSFGKHWSLM